MMSISFSTFFHVFILKIAKLKFTYTYNNDTITVYLLLLNLKKGYLYEKII